MNAFTYSMALLMGLTGSLHCAGMCGPIVWVMPFSTMKGLRKWLAIGLYHFGRISIYALLAIVLYSFKGLFQPEWQRYISIALGVSLLVAGIVSFIPGRSGSVLPWSEAVRKLLGRFIGNPSLSALLVSGMLNGLLPCGLVYMALSATTVATSTLQAAMLMYAFGFGTMPALISITILRSRSVFGHMQYIKRLVPVALFVFGGLLIVRGMNLGVPYLSPKVSVEHNEVKASCCHNN